MPRPAPDPSTGTCRSGRSDRPWPDCSQSAVQCGDFVPRISKPRPQSFGDCWPNPGRMPSSPGNATAVAWSNVSGSSSEGVSNSPASRPGHGPSRSRHGPVIRPRSSRAMPSGSNTPSPGSRRTGSTRPALTVRRPLEARVAVDASPPGRRDDAAFRCRGPMRATGDGARSSPRVRRAGRASTASSSMATSTAVRGEQLR